MRQSFRRKSVIVTMMALAVTALSMVGATSAQAVPPIPPHGQVFNGDSPRCLDSGTPADAQLWNCSGSSFQKWLYTGNDSIAANTSGGGAAGCLDAGAAVNGSLVHLAPCSGAAGQKWLMSAAHLVNGATGRCLDADLGTIGANGTRVQTWDCGTGSNQNWFFEFTP